MAKRTVKPTSGQVITVGKDGPPRLLVESQTTKGELDVFELNGRIAYKDVLKSGALYDGYYLFAAHDLESYFKKKLETRDTD